MTKQVSQTETPQQIDHALTEVFSSEFLSIPTIEISEAIRKDGYFSIESALTEKFLDHIEKEAKASDHFVNSNWVHGVNINSQYYMSHLLAVSQSYYNYATHPKIFAISDELLGDTYRVKAQRYYETYGGSQQRWHTDNKTDRTFAHIPGLIFIFYVSDVNDGEFQFVRGSHEWSGDKAYNNYDDKFIDEHYAEQITSFKGPKGTIVIYDTYGIHRAKPVIKSSFARKSVFMQIDSEIDNGEPLLINAKFLTDPDPRMRTYFGFGKPADYSVFPSTRDSHMPISSKAGLQTLAWLPRRILRSIYEAIPNSLKSKLKRYVGK
jgi:hypothetical protein